MDIEFRISHIRGLMCHRGDVDYDREIERHLDELQSEIGQLLAIAKRNDAVPAHITVALRAAGDHFDSKDTPMATQFPLGTTIMCTAHVANAESVDLPAAPVSWSVDNGTISVDPTDSHKATLFNATLGTVNVVATTDNGIAFTATAEIVDNTPASITVDMTAA